MPIDIMKQHTFGERKTPASSVSMGARENRTTHRTVLWHLVCYYSTTAVKRAFEKLRQ